MTAIQIATTAQMQAAVDALIAGAPGALDTLNELAAALGDDQNFAASVTTALGNRLNYRGAWAATTAYATNDLVMHNGGAYRALAAFTSGGAFVAANWENLSPEIGTYAPRTWKVVAASDSSAKVKAAADYVCDGTADDVEINAALAAAGPAGLVMLAVGNFSIAASINLNQHGQALVGSAMWRGTSLSGDAGQTNQIQLAAGANCNMVEVTARKCYLAFCYFDGNFANNNAGTLTQTFTDGAITGGTTLTSATAKFTPSDVGRSVPQTANIPAGTTIAAVTAASVSSVTLSQSCTNGNGLTFSVVGRSLVGNIISAIVSDNSFDFHCQYVYAFNGCGHGVDIQGAQVTLDHVYPEGCVNNGLHVWGTASHLKCLGVTADGNGTQGIVDESAGNAPSSTTANVGFNTYIDCEVIGAPAHEAVIFAYGTSKQWIGGNVGAMGHEAFRIVGGIRGCLIDGAAVYNAGRAGNNTYDAIAIAQGADGSWPLSYTIANVQFISDNANKPRYLVNEVNAAAGPGSIYGCAMRSTNYATAAVNTLNPQTTVGNNPGYVNKATGSATVASGSTSIVVNHGLSLTPTIDKIALTKQNKPTNAVGSVWVSGITGTQFTINTDVDPGAGGLAMSWQVAA